MQNAILRPALERDRNFCLKSWLRTFRHSDATRSVESSIYYDHMGPVVQTFLDQAQTIVAVDGSPNPSTELLGFITFQHLTPSLSVLHYAYVKDVMRGFGIGRQLFEAAGLEKDQPFLFTFMAPEARKLKKHYRGASHFPYHWFQDRFAKGSL